MARELARALRENDYTVFPDEASLTEESDWASTIKLQISQAVREGFVLALMSPSSVRMGSFLREELTTALSAELPGHNRIIPIMLSECIPPIHVATVQYMNWTHGSVRGNTEELLQLLRTFEIE